MICDSSELKFETLYRIRLESQTSLEYGRICDATRLKRGKIGGKPRIKWYVTLVTVKSK